MKHLLRLLFVVHALACCTTAQTVNQWELRKRTSTGFTSYGITAENGKAIGFTGGIPAMLPITTSPAWADITGKPTEFPPAAHDQAISTITGLQTALDAKANPSALSSYLTTAAAASTYAPLASPAFMGTITGASLSLSGGISVTGSIATGSGNFETTVGNISTGSGTISGNGSGITALNASNISSGTLSIARIADASITTTKITGLAASATTDTTSATNITSGTLPIARIADASVTLAKLAALPMQDETLTYYKAVLAAGGSISMEVLARLDELIADAKANSYWSDILEAYPFCTDSFTGVFVKLKAASGAPASLTNNNFVSTDYARSAGFGVNSGNTTKWLQSGFTPSTLGIDRTNIGLIASITSDSVTAGPSSGHVIGDMISGNASECGLFLEAYGTNNAIGAGGALVYQALNPSARVLSSHGNATLRHACMDGVQMVSSSGTYSGTLTGEISLFRVTRFGAARFQNGRIGFVAITTYMTPTKAKAATAAISRFERAIRSIYARQDAGLIAWGDSITATQGGGYTSFTSNAFAPIVGRRSGLRLVNLGNMAARIDTDATQIAAVNQRSDVFAMPERTLLFMYGSNDVQAGTSDTTYNTALTSITGDARAANRRMVICTPCFSQNATHQTTLRSYASRCATAALTDGHLFADTNLAIADLATPSSAMTDTVHPNATGHSLMAEVVLAAMRGQQLRRPIIDLASLAAGASITGTVTMLTARAGQSVTITPPSTFDAGMIISGYVSANDTVTYTATNTTAGAIDEQSGAFTITISQ